MTDSLDQDETFFQYATLFTHFDTDASLYATSELVKIIRKWRGDLAEQIDQTRNGKYIDPDLGHESVYQEAASSHAIASAIAPFIEGTLRHGFGHLKSDFDWEVKPTAHARWRLKPCDFWEQKNLVPPPVDTPSLIDGSIDIFDALGCLDLIHNKFESVARALFVFRNNAFHNGYEWQPKFRKTFFDRCTKNNWQEHFQWSRIDGELWIASFSDSFIDDCLLICDSLVKSFENIRIRWTKEGRLHPTDATDAPDWIKLDD